MKRIATTITALMLLATTAFIRGRRPTRSDEYVDQPAQENVAAFVDEMVEREHDFDRGELESVLGKARIRRTLSARSQRPPKRS